MVSVPSENRILTVSPHQQTKRTAILVLGMHRSGTSALTRVLNLMGCDLPKTLMEPNNFNEAGYWESSRVADLNDRMLDAAHSRWDDWRELDSRWLGSAAADRYLEEAVCLIAEEFGNSSLFVLKDPRICRLAAFWIEVFKRADVEPTALVQLRSPLEVAASLEKRDGLPPALGHLLWLRHVLDAEHGSRGLRRCFTSYDQMLRNWRDVVRNIEGALDIKLRQISDQAQQIDLFVAQRHRHYHQPTSSLTVSSELAAWFQDSMAILDRWTAAGENIADIDTLDRIRKELNHAGPAFGPYVTNLELSLTNSRKKLEGADRARHKDDAEKAVAAVRQQAEAEKAAAIEAVRREADAEKAAAVAAVRQQAEAEKAAAIEAVRREADAEKAAAVAAVRQQVAIETAAVSKQLAEVRTANDVILTSLSWRLTKPVRSIQERLPDLLRKPMASRRRRRRERRAYSALKGSRWFDESWYLSTYPDVAEAAVDPVMHYIRHGAQEGRNPSPEFSTSYYLDRYPDVRTSGINPLFHYVVFGEIEQRSPSVNLRTNPPDLSLLQPIIDNELATPLQFFPSLDPDITVIIPIFNKINYTIACLRSLSQQKTNHSFEIVIIDDGSTDNSADVLAQIDGIRCFRNSGNQGFIRSCNRGAENARGKYLYFLNNDTILYQNCIQSLAETFEKNNLVGIVGSQLIYEDGQLQEAGGIIWQDGTGWNWGRRHDPGHPRFNFMRDVDYVSASSLMIARSVFFQLGKFSEELQHSYYEDTWLAFAAREAGLRVIYQPSSKVIHFEGITAGRSEAGDGAKSFQSKNRKIFVEKWHRVLATRHLPNGSDPEIASDRQARGHILIIDACTPTPDRDSGSIDMFNLIKILLNDNFRVHFIPHSNFSHEGPYTERLQELGVECVYAPFYRSVRQYLEERGDIFSHILVARFPVAASVVDEICALAPSAARVFYTVDLHGLRILREAELRRQSEGITDARRKFRQELALTKRFDLTVVLSEYEADFVTQRASDSRVAVLPLIREYPTVTHIAPFNVRKDVVFIGGFAHKPNIDAARWLCNEIWPRLREVTARSGHPNIRLRIVGSNMPDQVFEDAADDIEVLGFVENLEQVFSNARLSVAPLRYGAGLKGKIATSLGYGVPVVGTDIAFEGMPADRLSGVRISANDARGLAEQIAAIYFDPARWNLISSAGLNYVHQHYSMAAIAPRVSEILQFAMNQHRRT